MGRKSREKKNRSLLLSEMEQDLLLKSDLTVAEIVSARERVVSMGYIKGGGDVKPTARCLGIYKMCEDYLKTNSMSSTQEGIKAVLDQINKEYDQQQVPN